MGKDEDHDVFQSDDILDSFLCCICLDLLYKPVVLSCGHMSCFWCVHKSMSGRRESHCPICRNPYNHFPAICEMLHFLLLKMYPNAYKRREDQILEEEKQRDCFSPQFGHSCPPHPNDGYNCQVNLAYPGRCHESNSSLVTCCAGKEEPRNRKEQTESIPSVHSNDIAAPKDYNVGSHEVVKSVSNKPKIHFPAANVLCLTCKQLLFRPVVLNCGHVYCETCIPSPVDERIKCHVCQSVHPKCIPKVCLEFNHFLEGQFPKEYAIRRTGLQVKQAHVKNSKSAACSTKSGKWWSDPQLKLHMGVGCDSCGVYPIVGDRYKCKDCLESIGYDLCGDCYTTRSKLPGRFNQQHTADHKFGLVSSNIIRNLMLRLVSGHMEDVSAIIDRNGNASQTAENGVSSVSPVNQETADGNSAALERGMENVQEQNDVQPIN